MIYDASLRSGQRARAELHFRSGRSSRSSSAPTRPRRAQLSPLPPARQAMGACCEGGALADRPSRGGAASIQPSEPAGRIARSRRAPGQPRHRLRGPAPRPDRFPITSLIFHLERLADGAAPGTRWCRCRSRPASPPSRARSSPSAGEPPRCSRSDWAMSAATEVRRPADDPTTSRPCRRWGGLRPQSGGRAGGDVAGGGAGRPRPRCAGVGGWPTWRRTGGSIPPPRPPGPGACAIPQRNRAPGPGTPGAERRRLGALVGHCAGAPRLAPALARAPRCSSRHRSSTGWGRHRGRQTLEPGLTTSGPAGLERLSPDPTAPAFMEALGQATLAEPTRRMTARLRLARPRPGRPARGRRHWQNRRWRRTPPPRCAGAAHARAADRAPGGRARAAGGRWKTRPCRSAALSAGLDQPRARSEDRLEQLQRAFATAPDGPTASSSSARCNRAAMASGPALLRATAGRHHRLRGRLEYHLRLGQLAETVLGDPAWRSPPTAPSSPWSRRS